MESPTRQTVSHGGCALSGFVVGEGPPVLMIQGVGCGALAWMPQIEALAPRYRCLSFDNRGFGESQPASAALTVDQMADDAIAWMDAQGWAAAHVVGHSLGGLVAQYVARKARARVRSLALMCTFATGAIPTRMDPKVLWIGTRSRIGTRRMRRLAFLELVMPPQALATCDRDALADQLGALFGHDLADAPPVVMQQFSAMRKGDATAWLGGFAGIPTLVLSGAHDPIAPPYAGKAIAEGIPGAAYVEYADGSHGLTVQHADRVNALLLAHLDAAEASDRG